MKRLRRLGAVLGGIFGLSAALGGVMISCSSSEGAAPPDAAVDVTLPEGAAGDGGVDADAAMDTGALPDVQATADPSKFPAQIVTALCERFRECCGVAPSAWDQSRCENTNNNNGGFKNLGAHVAALAGEGGTLVTYDMAQAATCLGEIKAFTCPPSAQTAAEYQKARDDCYAALKGTIALNGTGCTDDIHCAAGHCASGTCTALVGDGGACRKTDDCAYRGTSTPNLFCNNTDPDAGGVCVPRLDVGAACSTYVDYDYAACTGGLCDLSSSNCVPSAPFIDPGTCSFFAMDAGPG